VSEKFAGQQGPCPNCKTILNIPKKEEEVVIHAPEAAGPKDSKGQAVLKPILREETRFSTNWAVGVAGVVLTALLGAWLLRSVAGSMPVVVGALGAILLAPPLVLAGYTFLRNSELEPYRGSELWIRVAACAGVYAVLWGAYAWVAWVWEVERFEIWQLLVAGVIAVFAGGFAAFASLDLDFLVGMIHYSLYLIVTVLLSYIANLKVF
jgi:hypothetical protein